ncbi:MAG TPA: nucleotidyl transferase AbiEii/AbiGii toxin family protein, partial [Egibacteraceae bacterium]|nr:nucleotidyl transferase AbiEii/AbiGii toxin family protein [Egibacteraceae bacterium]
MAALVAGLAESERFVLAGGAAMAAHGVLERTTRELDYFAGPDDAAAVRRWAEAFERAALRQGLVVQQERSEPSFVRLSVSDGREQSEVDLAMDYRALEPVDTRYGPALDL